MLKSSEQALPVLLDSLNWSREEWLLCSIRKADLGWPRSDPLCPGLRSTFHTYMIVPSPLYHSRIEMSADVQGCSACERLKYAQYTYEQTR